MAENKTPKDQVAAPLEIESVKRVSHLPVVEGTLNIASNLYGFVKESNEFVGSVLTSAETTLKQAAEMAQPVVNKFEGPIKRVDSVLCSSLDYVEEAIPAVKLPPKEMYETTKAAVYSKVESASKYMVGNTTSQTMSIEENSNSTEKCEAGDKCCLHGKRGSCS